MNRRIGVSLTATIMGLATLALPACAADQPPASARQPTQLAQNNTQGPNLFSLYQQIQQLQQQVRDLNGQVDTLQYQLKQQEQGQRDLYQNLDKRLSALENGGGANAGQTPQAGGNGAGGQTGAPANVDPAVQSAYMDGFNKLKSGDYDGAIGAFKQFVDQHPETPLTDNAWYWLGEADYVQQHTDDARQAFETVVNRFGNSAKVPDSLYKIGLIDAAAGQNDNAQAMFQRVVDQYPDSDVAAQAKSKLGGGSGS